MSEYRQSLTDKVILAAMGAFVEKGIRAVKMDDIAASLSISKRTLYELFANKEVLVIEGVKRYYAVMRQRLGEYAASGASVMDVLLKSFEMKMAEVRRANPAFYADVEKYPALLAFFDENHARHMEQMIDFMKRGVDEGYFIEGLNYELVGKMFDVGNLFVMKSQLYRQYSMEDIFINFVFVSVRGICTTKGIDALDNFMASYERKQARSGDVAFGA